MAQIPCCDVITYKEYGNEQWMGNDKDMRKYIVNTGLLRSIIRERKNVAQIQMEGINEYTRTDRDDDSSG